MEIYMSSLLRDMSADALQKILDESTSFQDAINRLGGCISGANYKSLKKSIIKHECSLDVMNSNRMESLKIKSIQRYNIDFNDAFRYGSLIQNRRLKKLILQYGFINKCSECGISQIYNNKPITLQLDHINGDNKDNEITNLRLLCPNCHSQTKTWGSRNIKVDRTPKIQAYHTCIDCGNKITEHSLSGKCITCVHKHQEKFHLSYDAMKSILHKHKGVMTSVAREIGVSDNAIRKRCKRLGINWLSEEFKK